MRRRFRTICDRLSRYTWLPLAVLAVVSVLSLGLRAAWLDRPCLEPCATATDHQLIFDEVYYVNAARVIAGVPVPTGSPYYDAPPHVDPNSEHPQLVKLVIAQSIRFFGDVPLAWRLGSLICGSLAILGMYRLARAAGAGGWLAVGAAALLAADNLLLVHGRIGTLDIYVVTFMIWSAALYVGGKPLVAGLLLGVGTCTKLVAPYLLVVFALIEGLRLLTAWRSRHIGRDTAPPRVRERLSAWAVTVASCAMTALILLAVLDRVVPPFVPGTGILTGGPISHVTRMIKYGASLVSPDGPQGIASYPWQWLIDVKPIAYRNVDTLRLVDGNLMPYSVAHFLGVINPAILLLVVPSLLLAIRSVWRDGTDIDIVAVAWFLGTYLPFVALSLFLHRTSYLYYMVVVMPGCYLAVARLVSRPRVPWSAAAAWAMLVLVLGIVLYPFTVVPDPNWI